MTSVVLPNGRTTSRLGFGAGALRPDKDGKAAARLLDAAFDAGVRHFDVAPSYGLGFAEDVLGAFAATHRGSITLTTKVGIARPAPSAQLISRVGSVVRPLLGAVPGLKRRLGGAVFNMTTSRPTLSPAVVQASLADSLRRLRVETIDIFLLHEAGPEDINDELLQVLEQARQKGDIGCYGVGSERAKAEAVLQGCAEVLDVVQMPFELDDMLTVAGAASKPLRVTHGVFRQVLDSNRWMDLNPRRREAVEAILGRGHPPGGGLADLLLSAALAINPNGVVLSGSTQISRVVHNATLLADVGRLAAGARLVERLEEGQRRPQIA